MSQIKGTVYLGGPITGKTFDDANRWRRLAAEELCKYGIRCLSPLRGKDALKSKGVLHGTSYEGSPLTLSKGFVARDRFDVSRSDVVLLNFSDATSVSIGTMVEVGWADAARRPIVMIPDQHGLYKHGFLDELCQYIVPDLHSALSIVRTLILEG